MEILHKPKPCAKARGGKPPRRPRAALRWEGEGDAQWYREILWNGREIVERKLTRMEALAITSEDVDFLRDEAFGRHRIRTQDGISIEYGPDIPGVGDEVGITYLLEMMFQPGVYLTSFVLARKGPLASFINRNAMSGRLTKLRSAFGETAIAPFFFLTRRCEFASCWNMRRSWRIIQHSAE